MFNWVPLGEEEQAVNDPLMVLPRAWSSAANVNLDEAVKISDQAVAFEEQNFTEEVAWYQTYCGGQLNTDRWLIEATINRIGQEEHKDHQDQGIISCYWVKNTLCVREVLNHGYFGLRFEEVVFLGIGFQPGGNFIGFWLIWVFAGVLDWAGVRERRDTGLEGELDFVDEVERLALLIGFLAVDSSLVWLARLAEAFRFVRPVVEDVLPLAGDLLIEDWDFTFTEWRAGPDVAEGFWEGPERLTFSAAFACVGDCVLVERDRATFGEDFDDLREGGIEVSSGWIAWDTADFESAGSETRVWVVFLAGADTEVRAGFLLEEACLVFTSRDFRAVAVELVFDEERVRRVLGFAAVFPFLVSGSIIPKVSCSTSGAGASSASSGISRSVCGAAFSPWMGRGTDQGMLKPNTW
jgi:hypothetical protein